MIKHIFSWSLIMVLGLNTVLAQNATTGELLGQDLDVNTITTAVPFLLITPDSRGGAMGDAGVATSPDANSMHYNPAKFAFIETDMGFSVSYSPWLSNLIDDIHLLYASYFQRFGKFQTVAASLRYFSLGDITFTDIVGNTTGQFKPNEFAFDFAYSRLLSENFSGAISLRYIHSNLTGGIFVEGIESRPGNAVSSDVSFFYNRDVDYFNYDGKLAFGINISNMGNKISYTADARRDFLPANLKLGTAYTMEIDDYNRVMFTLDINKLLVPTPPYYDTDGPVDIDGNRPILYGKDPNVAVVSGIFQSFYDAPGGSVGQNRVALEEFREINYSAGIEYWYENQFAIRGGYFFEHPTKGNRQFFTMGIGMQLNVFSLDFSYLVSPIARHPLANTLRFTLGFNFENFQNMQTPKNI